MIARKSGNGQVVNTYVKALFSLAQEENKIEEINEGFKNLEERLRVNSSSMKHILYSGSRKKERKYSLDILTQNLLPLLKNFIGVLDRYQRLNLLFPIIQGYRSSLEEHLGFLPVLVESSTVLEENEKMFLRNYLKEQTGKEIILSVSEDPTLLGGFQMQVYSTLIDCSLKTKISELGKKLRGTS